MFRGSKVKSWYVTAALAVGWWILAAVKIGQFLLYPEGLGVSDALLLAAWVIFGIDTTRRVVRQWKGRGARDGEKGHE